MAEHVLVHDQSLLDALSVDYTMGAEEFLIWLEDSLESGELTIDEVSQLISDYNRASR